MPKTWLITGSSRGLGASITEAALEQGEYVIATARTVDALRPLVDRYGSRVLAVALDVTDTQAAARAVLGFEELSSFSRSFQSWEGTTPTRYRASRYRTGP